MPGRERRWRVQTVDQKTDHTNVVLDRVEADLDAARERWFSLLRIPSISAQPAHNADCRAAAEWVPRPTRRHGLHRRGACDRRASGACSPTIRDPAATRRTCCSTAITTCSRPSRSSCGPARPSSRPSSTGRTASASTRGAPSTTKGQVMTWLEALRAWHAVTGVAPGAGDGAGRGRGGDRQPQPRAVHRGAASDRLKRRRGGHQRHRHVGHRHARRSPPACAAWSTPR